MLGVVELVGKASTPVLSVKPQPGIMAPIRTFIWDGRARAFPNIAKAWVSACVDNPLCGLFMAIFRSSQDPFPPNCLATHYESVNYLIHSAGVCWGIQPNASALAFIKCLSCAKLFIRSNLYTTWWHKWCCLVFQRREQRFRVRDACLRSYLSFKCIMTSRITTTFGNLSHRNSRWVQGLWNNLKKINLIWQLLTKC